jgi:hypothetical protein
VSVSEKKKKKKKKKKKTLFITLTSNPVLRFFRPMFRTLSLVRLAAAAGPPRRRATSSAAAAFLADVVASTSSSTTTAPPISARMKAAAAASSANATSAAAMPSSAPFTVEQLSESTRRKLAAHGIATLFDIQSVCFFRLFQPFFFCFDIVFFFFFFFLSSKKATLPLTIQRKDVVGRAYTGTGKVIPSIFNLF